jgi:hypothetical protein
VLGQPFSRNCGCGWNLETALIPIDQDYRKALKGSGDPICSPEPAFPNDNDSPSIVEKRLGLPVISHHVHGELLVPERSTTLRPVCQSAAGMSVPEASMYQDDRLVPPQGDVRMARKTSNMQTKSVACCVQPPADDQFRARVGPANAGHVCTTLKCAQRVRHGSAAPSESLSGCGPSRAGWPICE